MLSFLPKALCFKEWKENRWWMLTAVVLLMYQPVYSIWGFLMSGDASSPRAMLWQVLMPTVYHSSITGTTFPIKYVITANPAASMFAGFVAMGLGIALFTVERNRGTLWFVLSGPVRRVDQFRVKITFAVTIVVLTLLLKVAVLGVCDIASGTLLPLSDVWSWAALNLIYDLALLAIGIACASVMMIGFHAGITAVIVSAIPWAIGKSIAPRLSGISPVDHVAFSTSLSKFLESMSPLSHSSGMTFTSLGSSSGADSFQSFQLNVANGVPQMGWVAIWFAVWTIGWIWLAYRAYQRTPIENNTHFFMFPVLWRWGLWFAVGVVSYLAVNLYASNHSYAGNLDAAYALLSRIVFVWVIFGLIVDFGLRAYLRSHASGRLKRRF